MSSQGDARGGGSLEPIWLGVGSPRPQPRVLQNSMFGHVADAFDEKSIFKIGQQSRTTTTPTTTTTTTTTTQTAAAVSGDQTTTTSGSSVGDGANGVDWSPTSDSSGPSGPTDDGFQTSDMPLDDVVQKPRETPLDIVCCCHYTVQLL